jgi:hypothetical protein
VEETIAVFRDHHGHCCIRVEVHRRYTEYIINDGRTVDAHKMLTDEFDRTWILMHYDVERAANKFLNPMSGVVPVTPRARARLLPLTTTKEDEMSEATAKKSAKEKLAKPATEEAKAKVAAKKAVPAPAPKTNKAAKSDAKMKAPAKPIAEESRMGRKRDNQNIKLMVTENPKRKGSASFDRFELYKKAKTTDEFLAAGGTTGDLRYDEAAGYIELS